MPQNPVVSIAGRTGAGTWSNLEMQETTAEQLVKREALAQGLQGARQLLIEMLLYFVVSCTRKTPPGVLNPVLKPPAQGHGVVAAGPKEGHEADQRAGAPIL